MALSKKTIKSWVKRLLPWSAQRLLYRWYAFHYIDRLPLSIVDNRPTVVIFNHFFDQDVRALTLANKGHNLVIIDAPRLFLGAKIFFSEEVCGVRSPYTSADSVRVEQYRRECHLLLERLKRRMKVDVIVATSDIFYWIREFVVVARQSRIPFAILDKEGTISPYAFDAVAERIRTLAPFMSDHIFVWSERQRSFWHNMGVASARITVVGQARSDLFHVEQNRNIDALFPCVRPLIAYFTFDDRAYMPRERLDRGMSWNRLKTETLDDLVALATEHSEYNFLVKAHPQQEDLGRLQEEYARDNLIVVGGSNIANELIQRAELIMAFQTTAVIEAMLLKRRVIYTAWDENYNRYLLDDLLPFHEAEGIIVARTRQMFQDVCRRFFAGDFSDFDFSPAQQKARDDFVNEYLWQPDGHVCERFFKELDRFLGETTI